MQLFKSICTEFIFYHLLLLFHYYYETAKQMHHHHIIIIFIIIIIIVVDVFVIVIIILISLDYVVNRFFMKLFQTSNIDIVKCCSRTFALIYLV